MILRAETGGEAWMACIPERPVKSYLRVQLLMHGCIIIDMRVALRKRDACLKALREQSIVY